MDDDLLYSMQDIFMDENPTNKSFTLTPEFKKYLDDIKQYAEQHGCSKEQIEELMEKNGITVDKFNEILEKHGITIEGITQFLQDKGINYDNFANNVSAIQEYMHIKGLTAEKIQDFIEQNGLTMDKINEHLENHKMTLQYISNKGAKKIKENPQVTTSAALGAGVGSAINAWLAHYIAPVVAQKMISIIHMPPNEKAKIVKSFTRQQVIAGVVRGAFAGSIAGATIATCSMVAFKSGAITSAKMQEVAEKNPELFEQIITSCMP